MYWVSKKSKKTASKEGGIMGARGKGVRKKDNSPKTTLKIHIISRMISKPEPAGEERRLRKSRYFRNSQSMNTQVC